MPGSAGTRALIEALVFLLAAATTLFCGGQHSLIERLVALALVMIFFVLGLPNLRTKLGEVTSSVADFILLTALVLVHAQVSALLFIIVASGFRNGFVLTKRTRLSFTIADAAVLAVAVFATAHNATGHSTAWVIETSAYAGVALTLVLVAIRYGNNAREAYDALLLAHQELRGNVDRVAELAVLRERERIAHDIHDELGHELTTLAMQIDAARCLAEKDGHVAESYLSRAHAMSLSALGSVRRSVGQISGDPLERGSFDSALHRICDRFQLAAGIKLSLSTHDLPDLPPSTTTHVINILREALTNVARHADATSVDVRARIASNRLDLTVEDDGRGFDVASNGSGRGLRGMSSRATAINGVLSIRSTPGCGSAVHLSLPGTK